MGTLMHFDYLHAARPAWIAAVTKFAVPAHLLHASYALAAAAAIVAGAGWIEHSRALQAQKSEALYRQRYDRSVRSVNQVHVYSSRVAALVALDRRVRGIVASGDANARKLADIADHLPPHAWLTSVTFDAGGLELEGRARNFEVLGGVMRELMRAQRVHNPVLTGAQATAVAGNRTLVKYGIRLESSP